MTNKPTWDKFEEATAVVNGHKVDLDPNQTIWKNKFYTVIKHILEPELGDKSGIIFLFATMKERRLEIGDTSNASRTNLRVLKEKQ